MIEWLILAQMADVSIQPTFQPPSPMDLARPVAQLAGFGPLDWTCSVRPPSGPEFIVAGRFERPAARPMITHRPVSLRIVGREPLSGKGSAGWGWPSRRDGRYWFEVKAGAMIYSAEMDFIQPGQQGYIKLLSSSEHNHGATLDWRLAGVGLCTATAGAESGAEQ